MGAPSNGAGGGGGYIVMVYIVMAYIVMARLSGEARIVMAYIDSGW